MPLWPSKRNQLIDLHHKSVEWIPYESNNLMTLNMFLITGEHVKCLLLMPLTFPNPMFSKASSKLKVTYNFYYGCLSYLQIFHQMPHSLHRTYSKYIGMYCKEVWRVSKIFWLAVCPVYDNWLIVNIKYQKTMLFVIYFWFGIFFRFRLNQFSTSWLTHTSPVLHFI